MQDCKARCFCGVVKYCTLVDSTREYNIFWRLAEGQQAEVGEEITASNRSIFCWQSCMVPYQMTGGIEAANLHRLSQVCMAVYMAAYPDSQAEKVVNLIYNKTGEVHS